MKRIANAKLVEFMQELHIELLFCHRDHDDVFLHIDDCNLCCCSKPYDTHHVFCAATEPKLLLGTAANKRHNTRLSYVESADAFGAMYLV